MVDEVPETPLTGCLVRVVWLFGGIGALALLLVPIVMNDLERLSFVSIAYLVVVGLIVVARYVDLKCFAGMMPDGGTPSTLRDAHLFSARLVVIASVAWLLAHAL